MNDLIYRLRKRAEIRRQIQTRKSVQEGVMRVTYGCYVIQGVKGELYPCQPDIFESTYELVE